MGRARACSGDMYSTVPATWPGGVDWAAVETSLLISASVLGLPAQDDAELDRAVRRQLDGWFGAQVAGWQLLRIYRIRQALPAMDPPLDAPAPARLGGGLYLCGDHAADSSINGAMASGQTIPAASWHCSMAAATMRDTPMP